MSVIHAGTSEDNKSEIDVDVSRSLLNRAPRRNPSQAESSGTSGSGSGGSGSRAGGDGRVGSPLLRGSPRSSGPISTATAPDQDLDPLLLRPPRNRPTPPPPPRGNGLRRGSGSALQRPAAVGAMGGTAAPTVGLSALSPQLGVVGVRQELVQGRAILFGVVGLRTGTIIGERCVIPSHYQCLS